ncbi:ribosomal biogenesis factor-like isoform X2 [Pan paniscus]|uniref:ribosomal biogenesis factor-like isoform X2 n=1 Tax=Pan paniscus TaxID=9597 RepID=UPI00243736F6|nr:ribosomal biogenesis factor-like isoform X2 [Pan paniscus]
MRRHLEFKKLHASIEFLTTAKNKFRGQKSRNVFRIASQKSFKAKNRVKPITANLKKIHIMNDEKLIPQQRHEIKPVNVDEATKLMAQL